ncbi:MAG: 4-alpha-glucanotransferase [Coriobacteriales bacterium]|nr:4-alpha-glucanotransferase [Coriobacteriales bacterium]
MRAKHVTSSLEYRDPFGAARVGVTVTLRIDVWDEPEATAKLRLWTDEDGEELIEMESAPLGDAIRFSASFTPEIAQIVWYSFEITAANGDVWRYGAHPERSTGEGAFAYGEPPSFQITCYELQRSVFPDWYKNGIVYQIFPDRFARGKDWEERAAAALKLHPNGPKRKLVDDWYKTPSYKKAEDGSIAEWEFYGGTLEGIREHLDYLQGLGVTVLYLNPIFEAQSNHRYDTGNYMQIDPMLGDEESFTRLCEEARDRGISIILDGVFNHTGADSMYFNRLGNYDTVGAYQSPDSPYRDWFKLCDDGTYECWWGVDALPDLNEDNPDYRKLICGEDGVVRKWLRAGARGWRLDVADELPDDFIAEIKAAELAEKPHALLIGEVWEDATTKVAYGQLRKYFHGHELDGVMNYPLRHAVLDFLTDKITAEDLANATEQLCENYPGEAFRSTLNLLGSHDRIRLMNVLGNSPHRSTLGEEQKASFRLDKDHHSLGVSRLWVAALMQMTLPGVPCIYYGDEAGMEGYTDPYNRGPYPWGKEDTNCTTIYRNAIAIRKALPVFTHGVFRPFALNDDVFGYWRHDGKTYACVLINRSLSKSHTVRVPMRDEAVSDIISGRPVKVVEENGEKKAEIFMWPLGTSVLYFHKQERLQAPIERGMGVLAHITSVPNDGKPGELCDPSKRFVDWLAEAGVKYWQILPVNPCDRWGSPYAGLSAFAGNPMLVDWPKDREGYLENLAKEPEYKTFCEKHDEWLTPYATFRAIKDLLGEDAWQAWPEHYWTFSPSLARDKKLADGVERNKRIQYAFQVQWNSLRAYANRRGIKIIGDMPMYVSSDSADVWAHRDIFALDKDGATVSQAGAPPDPLGPEGQLWGNPTFRWDVLKDRGYDWWMARFERMFELYDYVRLDHFLGFSSYYSIPQGKTALEGSWRFGPGLDLFQVAHDRFGQLPIIAEDLGTVTPAIRALVAATGAPGMSVVQFVDEDVRNGFHPAPGACAFTGTHDTQTVLGWVKKHFGLHGAQAMELAKRLNDFVLGSESDLAVLPLQDVLLLGDDSRMNVPGVAEGNWSWKAEREDLNASSEYLAQLVKKSKRG